VGNNFVFGIGLEDNFGSEATHDTTRLAFLGMCLNIDSVSLDMMNDVADFLPVHSQNIPTLFLGFSLVVVEEEAFGFHWTRRITIHIQ
jgi:hypothetical protein